jgi:hypothetical protein
MRVMPAPRPVRGAGAAAAPGAPAAAAAAAPAFEVNFDDFSTPASAGAASAAAAIPDWGTHAHEEEEDEEGDEEVEEVAEMDIFGGPAGVATGARARRRSSYVAATGGGVAGARPAAGSVGSGGSRRASASTGSAGEAVSAGGTAKPSLGAFDLSSSGSTGGAAAPGLSSAAALAAAAAAVAPKKDADVYEGAIWLRVSTAFVLKRWRERYAALRHGSVSVWADRASMLRGDAPVETITISPLQALSTMKVNATGADGRRLYYRHLVEMESGAALTTVGGAPSAMLGGDNEEGTRRVFKFGSDSQTEFERWTRALRAAIELAHARDKEKASNSMALAEATNAADLFRHAIASPRDRPKRRSSIVTSGPGGGTINVSGCTGRLPGAKGRAAGLRLALHGTSRCHRPRGGDGCAARVGRTCGVN